MQHPCRSTGTGATKTAIADGTPLAQRGTARHSAAANRLGGDAHGSWSLPSHSRLGGDGEGAPAGGSAGGSKTELNSHSRYAPQCHSTSVASTEHGVTSSAQRVSDAYRCTGCAIATLTLVGCTAAREQRGNTTRVPAPLDHCTDRTAQAGTAATGWVGMRRRHGPCLAIQDWAGTRQVPAAKALPALRHRWTRIRVIPSLVLPLPAEYRNLLSTTRPPACGRQRWHG